MEQERYEIRKVEDNFVYWFFSEGPKGKILKGVRFQHKPELGKNFFNIAFGDWDETSGRIDDQVITNNEDHLKVLHSVAEATRSFMNFWPDAIMLIRGSTISRTRLYQMGIAAFWEEIGLNFQVWGELGEEWEPFRKGVNYSGFLVFKKIN